MRRLIGAAAALALALVAAGEAGAHVVPQPAWLTAGQTTTVTFAAPNERPSHNLVGLTITAPDGVGLEAAQPPPGWDLSIEGRTARWQGKPLGRAVEVPFRLRLSTTRAPGNVTVRAVQLYDDGGRVRWNVALTVLPAAAPAPRQHLLPAVVTAILGLVVIGLLLLRMRERRQPRTEGD